jgi:F-type H+-transporting ATPase subunit a
MSSRRKILLGVVGFYVISLFAIVLIFGFTRRDNDEFQPQNEFKLDTWIDLPGPFDINKAVMYLVIAGILTCVTMIWIAGRMQARPNRVQTAVEVIFSLMRDNITRGNLDDRMAKKYFPFIGALFLFIWFSNLIGYIPLPTNTHEKVDIAGFEIPAFAG